MSTAQHELPSQEGVQSAGRVDAGQMDLLPPGESDAAFFLSPEQLRKRYTAAQTREIEGKRELILMCLAAGFPVEDVARNARVNLRTVQALVARDGEKVAGNLKTLGVAIRTLGARWYALARAKESDATFIQLAQAASFAVQRSNEIEVIAGMGEVGEKDLSIASQGVDPCARLRALVESRTPAPADSGDESSDQDMAQAVEGQPAADRDAGRDAVEAAMAAIDQEQEGGGGGGSGSPSTSEILDDSKRSENLGKGDPS